MKIKETPQSDATTLEVTVENVDGKMVAVATDETMDRDGEVLDSKKWDLANYKKNPVLQAGHSYLPQSTIGVAKDLHIDGKRLLFTPVFHEITQLAREIKKMFDEGILKTFSVGFIRHFKRADNGQIVRDDNGWPAIDRYELLEISAVPVPANPGAEVIQRSIDNAKKEVDGEQLKQIDHFVSEIVDVKTEEKPKEDTEEKAAAITITNENIQEVFSNVIKLFKDKKIDDNNLSYFKKAATELQDLLGMSKEVKPSGDKQAVKGRDPKEVQKPRLKKDEVTVRALQRVAKEINFALRNIKN